MSADPLPCPFCSGEATVGPTETMWMVYCNNVGCAVGAETMDSDENYAIAAWNRRAPLQAQGVALDDRTAALCDLQYDAGARAGFMAGERGDDAFIARLDARTKGAVGALKSDGVAQGVALTDEQIIEVVRRVVPIVSGATEREFVSMASAMEIGRALLAQAQPADASRQMAGADDALDAERYRWLKKQFIGYDFFWGGDPDADSDAGKGTSSIVFQAWGNGYVGRDIEIGIDAAIAAIGSAAAEIGKAMP